MTGLAVRRAVLAVALALLAHRTPAAQPAPPPAAEPSLTLEELERRALENNPTVRQALAAIEAARGRARQAGLLPNPIVGYVGEEINTGPTIRGGEHGMFVEQTIPLGGKLRLRREVFEREVAEAEVLAELQRQRVVTAVRLLFYEALAAERRVEVGERLALLADEATFVSRQLFNVGAADQPDLLESDIEARRARLEVLEARNQRFATWRRLASVVGDPALSPRPLAGAIDAPIPELDRAAALRALLERSPEVLAARAAAARARAAVASARREPFPDLFLRGGPRYNRELLEVGPGGAPRAVGWEAAIEAGVSIPLFDRNQGGIAAATAELERAEGELRRVELALEFRLAGVFDQYLTSLRAAEVYRTDVLPRAEQAYRLYLARYRDMAAAYPQVLIAQRTLFQMTGEYFMALERAWQSALQIQGLLVGEGEAGIGGRGSVDRNR